MAQARSVPLGSVTIRSADVPRALRCAVPTARPGDIAVTLLRPTRPRWSLAGAAAGAARPAAGVAAAGPPGRPALLAAPPGLQPAAPVRRREGWRGDGGGALACAAYARGGSRPRGRTAWRRAVRRPDWSSCGRYGRTTPRSRPR